MRGTGLGAPPGRPRPPSPLALLGAGGAEGCAPPRFALASHFFWGLWSILQAKISTIEFGYLVSAAPGGAGWAQGGAQPPCGAALGLCCSSPPPPAQGSGAGRGPGSQEQGGVRG